MTVKAMHTENCYRFIIVLCSVNNPLFNFSLMNAISDNTSNDLIYEDLNQICLPYEFWICIFEIYSNIFKKNGCKKIFLTQTLSIKLHHSNMISCSFGLIFPFNLSERYEVVRDYMIFTWTLDTPWHTWD